MCEYLGKKKLYELLKMIIKPEIMQIMKDCEYRKYRGSEWLSMCVDYDYVIKIYRSGFHVAVDFFEINDYDDSLVSLDRMCFGFCNNILHVNYWRNEQNCFVEDDINLIQLPFVGGM